MAKAQVYNNEWIDYQKTYYKFKVGKTGVYRIPQAVLATAGLGATPAEQFQLWRNGVQVPVYTSLATGVLSGADYIEFWGEQNDGRPDKELYRDPAYQLNNKWSLETDTAAYFLTVNPVVAENFRLRNAANNVAGNTLPAEPYFMYTAGSYFRNMLNAGYFVNVGESLYSSSYDIGEGWTSPNITSFAATTGNTYGSFTFSLNNLFVYNGGPAPKIKMAVSGNAYNPRRYKVTINGDSVMGKRVDFLGYSTDTSSFQLNTISSGNAAITVTNYATIGCYTLPTGGTTCQVDRMVIHTAELTYPRQFNFGGAANFEFSLPASTAGNFLQITNFSYGTSTPVLYDLTNGQRYIADLSAAPVVKFVLQPSATERKLILVSEETANVATITALQSRSFMNYSLASNQGDYLIITSPVLFAGPNGTNPIADYKTYRSSVAGGSFSVNTYLAEDLIDQFGFGIKKNPAGIRNFIRFAKNAFLTRPKQVFIIGRGVVYTDQRSLESNPAYNDNLEKLNLVPTYGYPASDALLAAEPGTSVPDLPIGRLSVINGQEVAVYLKKVKEYEQAQATTSPLVSEEAWTKNVVHIAGGGSFDLNQTLGKYLNDYKRIIEDTLFGGNVTTFNKSSGNAVEQLNSDYLQTLFAQGISLMTYFGHSSVGTLEFNLDNPENYNNLGKYPMFFALGCNVGAYYSYSTQRFVAKETISEKYVLSPDRGMIGMVGSTHFGIPYYLDVWTNQAYREISYRGYGKSIGEVLQKTVSDVFQITSPDDFFARSNAEQTALNGDPAITLNPHFKADYVIEDPMVKVSPGFVSVADASFRVDARFLNLGKAPNKNIVIEIKRQYPDQSTAVILRDTIPGVRFEDSITINVPIDPIHEKGLNRITVTIDADNAIAETYENNNTITKDVMIYDNDARPIYPYNFAIVNRQNIKLYASTANPFSVKKTYRMEMDTTELFNSPLKIVRTIDTSGGVLEFTPGITFSDSTVYYWRVSPDAGNVNYKWNTASFVYLENSEEGFNQSHLFQHFKSNHSGLFLDSSKRIWSFEPNLHNLFARNTVFLYGGTQEGDFTLAVDGEPYIRSACLGHSLVFNVFDQGTFKPWKNVDAKGNNLYRFGSASANCASSRNWNFEFSYMTPQSRKLIMDFMDSIPIGAFVAVRSFDTDNPNSLSSTWRKDTSIYGSNNSLYHKLLSDGFADIDSLITLKSWVLIYQKGVNSFQPVYTLSQGLYDKITTDANCNSLGSNGTMMSPVLGPSKAWKEFRWKGVSIDYHSSDNPVVDILGIRASGNLDTLIRNITIPQETVDISAINAAQYPYIQLRLRNEDTINHTPYQLKHWRLTYEPVPEGAVSPNIFLLKKDTLEIAEPYNFGLAFKNVTNISFDSVRVKMIVTDRNNRQQVVYDHKYHSLPPNDTLKILHTIDTRQLVGNNGLYVEVNPDNDQPEQFHFNNFGYLNFYVKGDTLQPVMDVTFDNLHIVNNDIVSSKPTISIKLQDEAKWFVLNDTSSINVQIRYPNGSLRTYHFGNDTMQFIPAKQAPNSSNSATVNLKPYFKDDGDYELIISGRDMSNNQTGAQQYRVTFQVINKAMISNMLNYPNPFTTSTAFVFTLTGSEVPQNIRIQILTITGKVVKEITKEELGPLHIGRNITEYKWDGRDQYGGKLANGIYLYRVVTNLNGKGLEKYRADDDNTNKFFNNGYGKMYLMR